MARLFLKDIFGFNFIYRFSDHGIILELVGDDIYHLIDVIESFDSMIPLSQMLLRDLIDA